VNYVQNKVNELVYPLSTLNASITIGVYSHLWHLHLWILDEEMEVELKEIMVLGYHQLPYLIGNMDHTT
jgi:hypothetical protein